MRKHKLLILFLLLLITLTGCFEKREVEDLAYVIAIGLDKGTSENSVNISFQLAVPIKIAGEGSNGSGKESTSLITLETNSISNAVSRADTMISKEITLSHNKIIVLSEELAKENINYYLSALVTNREIRPKTSIIVHKGTAKEFLSNLEPVLETNPARYYDLVLDSSEYTGYATDNSLFHFYLSARDEFSSPFAVLTESIEDENHSTFTENTKKPNLKTNSHEPTPQQNTQSSNKESSEKDNQQNNSNTNRQAQVGDASNENTQMQTREQTSQNSKNSSNEENQSSQNNKNSSSEEEQSSQNNKNSSSEENLPKTANIAGIAIFKNGKLVGEIRNEQIISQLILQDNLKKVNIDIEDIEDNNKTSVIKIVQEDSPNIKVKIENNKPKIDIQIKLNCQLITSGSAVNYNEKENRKKLEQKIQKKLQEDMNAYLKTITQDFKADPVGFGKYCRLNVSTLNELSKIKWEEIFPNSTFNVQFKIHLDTTQMVSNEQRK